MKTKIKAIIRTDLPTKGEEKRIDLRVLCQGRYTQLTTGYFVKPSDWDKSGRGSVKGASIEALATNRYLSKQFDKFDEFLLQCGLSGAMEEITIDDIKGALGSPVNEPADKKPERTLLEEIFDIYVDKLEVEDARPNTIRNVKSSKRMICGYAHKRHGTHFYIDQVDLKFLQELKKYLKNELENKPATIAKKMENLRAAIRWAVYNGYEMKNPFEGGYNKLIPMGEMSGIFLNGDEYKAFKAIQLPEKATRSMKLSHMLYIFSCETGLRYSDMQDLKWEHLKVEDDRFVSLTKLQVKTRGKVTVPVSSLANSIIKSYGSKTNEVYVFDRIAGQTINDNLKILAKMAGIDKYLTYHSSRHTFASALAEAGAGVVQIMHLLGDKKLDLARTYVNVDEQGLKAAMSKVWEKRANEPALA